MTDFTLKALDYGVLGICAVMLIATWRIIGKEQSRGGNPRKGIINISRFFMGFCLLLAILNGYVQIIQGEQIAVHKERVDHDSAIRSLETLRQVSLPLLNTRELLVNQLPDDLPQKVVLTSLLKELKKAFKENETLLESDG